MLGLGNALRKRFLFTSFLPLAALMGTAGQSSAATLIEQVANGDPGGGAMNGGLGGSVSLSFHGPADDAIAAVANAYSQRETGVAARETAQAANVSEHREPADASPRKDSAEIPFNLETAFEPTAFYLAMSVAATLVLAGFGFSGYRSQRRKSRPGRLWG